jgi:hypothetical protein
MDCNSTGAVTSSSPYIEFNIDPFTYAGGLVGYSSGAITNCYSTGTVASSSGGAYS